MAWLRWFIQTESTFFVAVLSTTNVQHLGKNPLNYSSAM
jgi:hypothetical protein